MPGRGGLRPSTLQKVPGKYTGMAKKANAQPTAKPMAKLPPTKHLPTIPSPTGSTGPAFEQWTPASEITVKGSRKGAASIDWTQWLQSDNVGGFENEDATKCYRNAVLVMLLTNDRFMGYIKRRHTAVAQEAMPEEDWKDHDDLLIQLHLLHDALIAAISDADLQNDKDEFWKNLTNVNFMEGWNDVTRDGQQDAREFLEFLLQAAQEQVKNSALIR